MSERELELDKLPKKRYMFSNDINVIRKNKYNLSAIMEEQRCNRNEINREFNDNINILLHKYNIKRDFFQKN